MIHTVFCGLQICAIIIPLMVMIRAMQEKPSRGLMLFTYCISGILLVEFGYFFLLIAKNQDSALASMKLAIVGKLMILIALPDFVEEYYRKKIPKWIKYSQDLFNIMFGLVAIFTEQNHLFFKAYEFTENKLGRVFHFKAGPLYWIYGIEVITVVVYSVITVIIEMRKKWNEGNHMKYLLMGIGIVLPGFSYSMFILRWMELYEGTSVALAASALIFFIDIVKYHLFDLTSNAKEYVLDHSVEAIMVVDPLKNILYMNQMVKEMHPNLQCYKPMSHQFEFLLEKPVTQFREHDITLESIRTDIVHADGKTQGYLIEVRDITESTKKKEDMNRLMQEAEAANQAKSAFLTNMSHEIRTPINAVLGMDEMILRESQDPAIVEYAQNIRSAGKSLLSLINDILDFSKIESGEMEIIPETYDFREIIVNAKQMIEPRLEGKEVSYSCWVNPEFPKSLFGDHNRVQQVLINLLTNAAKYTTRGSVHLHVDFRKQGEELKQGIVLIVSVQDTGSGIKQEDLDKLFQSFQRVDEEKNRNIEGTGLGLAITQKLLEAMNGQITVESEYGKGSTFRFEVKQGVIDATPIGETENMRKGLHKKINQERFRAPGAKVLVVDDNAVNIKVMKGLLKRNKVQFYAVMSGNECLENIKDNHYDLIFMDHLMPDLDGIETFHRMQKMKENACVDTPVIALTANAVPGIKQMYLDQGFSDYLMKPVSVDEMEEMMIQYLPNELLELTEG